MKEKKGKVWILTCLSKTNSRQALQVVFDILSVILKDNNKIMYVYMVCDIFIIYIYI